jgi:hypothetical protein
VEAEYGPRVVEEQLARALSARPFAALAAPARPAVPLEAVAP